ncbi:Rpr2-domain-containing protein [Xylariaceae sp. FL0016]|nr:Rpr2-domain-containing protein [Xylariaceae sp. FL0016]
MAKSKTGSVQNKPIYSRISYTYQAAAYLGQHPPLLQASADLTRGHPETEAQEPKAERKDEHKTDAVTRGLSRRLLTDLRDTSLKSQIRLSPALKHTICKFCDSLLIVGQTSSSFVENKSKGGKKPWAEVMVIRCDACKGERRFPVQAPRQKRRPIRDHEAEKYASPKQLDGCVQTTNG